MFEIPLLSLSKFQQFMTECLLENGLDPDLVGNKNPTAKKPTVEQENCYIACMDKRMGLMTADGSYDEDILFSQAETPEIRKQMKKKFDTIMKKCKIEAGDDHCKLAACISRQPRDFYL